MRYRWVKNDDSLCQSSAAEEGVAYIWIQQEIGQDHNGYDHACYNKGYMGMWLYEFINMPQ